MVKGVVGMRERIGSLKEGGVIEVYSKIMISVIV